MYEDIQLELWGELFVLHQSSNGRQMLAGWDGGLEGGFALAQSCLRVWTGFVPFCHHVRERGARRGPVISLTLQPSRRGLSVRELVSQLVARSSERTTVYEALGRRGITPRLSALGDNKLTLALAPALFPERAVPKIGRLDPGISEVTYDVQLDPANALAGPELAATAIPFGLLHLLE